MNKNLILSAVLGSVFTVPAAHAASLIIDDFVTAQTSEVSAAAPPSQETGNEAAAASAIGGQRDLYVEKISGDSGEQIRARINPNGDELLRQSIDDARGRTVLTWDGTDGNANPPVVAYNGLGGLDFSIYNTLDMQVLFSDLGGPINFTIWDGDDLTGATFAQTTFTVPGALPSGSNVMLSRNFNTDFTATGGTLADILDSVGAIQMEIDAQAVAQEGWDLHIAKIQVNANAIPLPSTILLFGLPLLALASRHQQRRHS